MNVLPTLHASVKNVKIHAKAILVVSMPNVWLETTELSVFALKDLLVIRSPFVKNVRSIQKFVVLSPKSFDSSIVSVFLHFRILFHNKIFSGLQKRFGVSSDTSLYQQGVSKPLLI